MKGYGKIYRAARDKKSELRQEIMNNIVIETFDNYLKDNYLNHETGNIIVSLELDYLYIPDLDEYICTDNLTILERYIKIYCKFHDIYLVSMETIRPNKYPYLEVNIDLNYPYLD